MIGTSLNQYQITARVGAGGMGEVFRARDTRLNRDVAVKVLPKDFVADADRLRRFEQEAKTLAALNHPNVPWNQECHGVVAPFLASAGTRRQDGDVSLRKTKSGHDRAEQIYRRLAGARGMDDAERWQHALFFAMSPQERCHFSLKTARSALSLRRSAKKT